MNSVKITHEDGTIEWISEKTRDLLISLGIKLKPEVFKPNNFQMNAIALITDVASRKYPDYISESMPVARFIEHYRTVKLQVPRQIGKTTLILEMAKEIKGSIVITDVGHNARLFRKEGIEAYSSTEAFRCNCFRGKTVTAPIVFLDEYNYFKGDFDLNKFLTCLTINYSTDVKMKNLMVVGVST